MTGKEITEPLEKGEILRIDASADVGNKKLDIISEYLVDLAYAQ